MPPVLEDAPEPLLPAEFAALPAPGAESSGEQANVETPRASKLVTVRARIVR